MDPIRNPFTPGAGFPPPELAGRDVLRRKIAISIERTRIGNPSKSLLLIGLRGVGKTVLLDKICEDAKAIGAETIRIEAPEQRSLPALIAPELRVSLLRLSKNEFSKHLATKALKALTGFAKSLKIKFQDIEVGFDEEGEPGLADNGDLEHDLMILLETSGRAAKAAKTVLIIFIDELQYVAEGQLESLIIALHRTAQQKLPIMLVGAGLPQLRGKMGKAKSYAERLFDFPEIGPLLPSAIEDALQKPAQNLGVSFSENAVSKIASITQGYPYFLQEWAKEAWDFAPESPISVQDIDEVSDIVTANLDQSFFRVRFDRLTATEKKYLRAMAELGNETIRSGDIAALLNRDITSLGPTRAQLINKGMIWSPVHGDTAFTVPLFADFMKRVMPFENMK